ncbi:MAG TPA: MqnA/MqnD/SBP family protein, partial [Candidatus Brocadiaceae bacterium]
MNMSLGFSPCPNDTFIFDAIINNKIDTEGLSFEVTVADVEELNRRAFRRSLDITKLSYFAYTYLVDDYILLTTGSALGNNCGPLLISKPEYLKSTIENLTI